VRSSAPTSMWQAAQQTTARPAARLADVREGLCTSAVGGRRGSVRKEAGKQNAERAAG
jgi:hypothetical protein